MAATASQRAGSIPFSVDYWANWWDNPDMATASAPLSPNIVGHWPGDPAPARGLGDYLAKIEQLLQLIPDLRLRVLEHAQNDNAIFIHYMASGSGAAGAFEFDGIDRLLIDENGLVTENVIRFDVTQLAAIIGTPPAEE